MFVTDQDVCVAPATGRLRSNHSSLQLNLFLEDVNDMFMYRHLSLENNFTFLCSLLEIIEICKNLKNVQMNLNNSLKNMKLSLPTLFE